MPSPTITDAPPTRSLAKARPRAVLYATSAGLGGSGLDTTSLEGVLASYRSGILRRAICYPVRQREMDRGRIKSLQRSPARLFSCLGSKDYYAAKKRYLDWVTSRQLRRGGYDFFHGWAGESFRTLVEARLRRIPSVLDVATWHRNKGVQKPAETRSEREARQKDRGWRDWRQHLAWTRLEQLAEYDLTTLLLMPSRKSEETFLAAGISADKLHYVGRGVDVQRYHPVPPPSTFRVAFTGALIKRKGVHHLLEAWKRLALADAELVLIGTLHEELKPYLEGLPSNVRLAGFTPKVVEELQRSAAFVFPSECEGFAKATLEAAACGLPLIATRESGDAIVEGQTGRVIPPNDPEALADALRYCHSHRNDIRAWGAQGREWVESRFTWDHYRARILEGYEKALTRSVSEHG